MERLAGTLRLCGCSDLRWWPGLGWIRRDAKKWVELRDTPDRAGVDSGDEVWRFLVGQLGQGEHG